MFIYIYRMSFPRYEQSLTFQYLELSHNTSAIPNICI